MALIITKKSNNNTTKHNNIGFKNLWKYYSKLATLFMSLNVLLLYYVIIASNIRKAKPVNKLSWLDLPYWTPAMPGLPFCSYFTIGTTRSIHTWALFVGRLKSFTRVVLIILFHSDITMSSWTRSFLCRTATGSGFWPTRNTGNLSYSLYFKVYKFSLIDINSVAFLVISFDKS